MCVCVKLWIHFIAGNTSGHNNLVGHMNGRQANKFIYRDCRCLFDDLSSPIPMCSLITSEELNQACLTEDCLMNVRKKKSNAFENVPFGDLKYGLIGSVPAEMVHVSGTGLLKHMFGCLDNLFGGPNSKKKVRNHSMIYTDV